MNMNAWLQCYFTKQLKFSNITIVECLENWIVKKY